MTPVVLFAFAATIVAFVMIIIAALYDFQEAGQKNFLDIVMRILRGSSQPHVTVLLYIEAGETDELPASLRSIQRSRYHEYDIVAVVHGSRQLLRQAQLCCQRSRSDVRWCSRPRTQDRQEALQYGYRRSRRGELVLVLKPGDMLPPLLIKSAAARFVADEKLQALRLRERVDVLLSLDSIAADCLEASRNLFHKTASVIYQARVEIGRASVMYQAALFGSSQKKIVPCKWASRLTVAVRRPSRQQPRMTAWLGAALVIGPLLIVLGAAIMYQAATLQSSVWLAVSWLFVSVWLAVVCVIDDVLPLRRRLAIILSLPTLYFLLYARLVVWLGKTVIILFAASAKYTFMRKFSYTAH